MAVGGRSGAIRVVVCAALSVSACQSPDLPPTETVVAPSAEHHAHIRSAEGARQLDALGVALGERDPEAEPSEAIDAEELIGALEAAGLTRAIVLSTAYQFGMPDHRSEPEYELVVSENEYVAEQASRYPEKLVALCSFNPLRDYAVQELERCANDERIGGLKLHLTNSDVDLRNEDHLQRLGDIFEQADQAGLPVLIHMRTRAEDYGARDVVAFIDRVLSRTNSIPVQIAHMAGWGGYDSATDAALGAFAEALDSGRLDRDRMTFGLAAVVFDPAAAGADTVLAEQVRSSNQMLADRIRQLGLDRVVYATDWPSWPPVADRSMRIERNMVLIRSVLPLESDELDQVLANVGAIFEGRTH